VELDNFLYYLQQSIKDFKLIRFVQTVRLSFVEGCYQIKNLENLFYQHCSFTLHLFMKIKPEKYKSNFACQKVNHYVNSIVTEHDHFS